MKEIRDAIDNLKKVLIDKENKGQIKIEKISIRYELLNNKIAPPSGGVGEG